MKKWMLPLTTLAATGLLLGATPVPASHADAIQEQAIHVLMNDREIAFPDAKPFVDENDRTMVPVRFVAESMGASVDWMPNTQYVIIKLPGRDIRMRVGENKATVNGISVMLDTKSVMTNDRTYVPLRFVSENLGADVKWDAANNAVKITYKNTTNNGGTFTPPPQDLDKVHITDLKLTDTDPWGRKIRHTNLPKNASDYLYILEDVPNWMYEEPYRVSGHQAAKPNVDTFKMFDQFNKKNINTWAQKIQAHFDLLLNVDYQNMPDDWVQKVCDTYAGGYESMSYQVTKYANWVKENEIKIEGSVQVEPSMLYYDPYNGTFHMRNYIKFRVDHYKEKKNVFLDPANKAAQFEPNVWYGGLHDTMYSASDPNAISWEVDPGGVDSAGSMFVFEHGPLWDRLE
ncbi:copper amine oxidase N-terminal domain-containing protein [Tumebacillus flagellatus]|uniref:Copper amine oxidase-like N-terminal domain-containing protein n=1 Tax=Tumebacillus flagellatus TaxID=1157490 RepID=A0A074LXG9_9BACL|nr:copper amine oxidase N-terminal domain-containing protein [Tumebacillus flagellatus]KEO85105.1 hypothetical protein EL26_00655 [Tumebacillus flagellatus]